MSITAVRPSVLYASEPWKSGSAQVPAFMILFGLYMTALCPSKGLVATVDHVHVPGVRTRVVRSGPTLTIRPSDMTKRSGYSGDVSWALVRLVHVFVARVVELRQRVHRGIGEGRQRAWTILNDAVAGEHQHTAVRQLRHGGIPTGLRHVCATEVRVRRGVVERRVRQSDVRADVAAGDECPAIRQLDVPGAEQVACIWHGAERVRRWVPHPLRVRCVVESVEREHLSRRFERHVNGDDRPRKRSTPLAVLSRRSENRPAGSREQRQRRRKRDRDPRSLPGRSKHGVPGR